MTDTLSTCENLLAGNANFTILHDESGERYTYQIARPKTGKNKGKLIARLLTGANNEADYTDLGEIDDNGDLKLTGRVGTGKEVPNSVALIRWAVKLATAKQNVPNGLTLHHAGKCLACGRKLTVPFPTNPYRPFGLGPECGAK